MLSDNRSETAPAARPQFGSEQMTAEMLRRAREHIAASIALLQSQRPRRGLHTEVHRPFKPSHDLSLSAYRAVLEGGCCCGC